MLAAECAWIILRSEHTRMRAQLAQVERALKARDWTRSGTAAASLVELIERLQAFEEATHRPKGVVLLEVLRGRSPEADQLLDELALESEHCNKLLSQAKRLLKSVELRDSGAAGTVEILLEEHQQLMRAHLDREDTLLHSHTALLLTGEEWAVVVSSMSAAMGAANRSPSPLSASARPPRA
jgi:hemerythrin-like domain-containing protein